MTGPDREEEEGGEEEEGEVIGGMDSDDSDYWEDTGEEEEGSYGTASEGPGELDQSDGSAGGSSGAASPARSLSIPGEVAEGATPAPGLAPAEGQGEWESRVGPAEEGALRSLVASTRQLVGALHPGEGEGESVGGSSGSGGSVSSLWGPVAPDGTDGCSSTAYLVASRYPLRFSHYLSTHLPLSDMDKLELLACPAVALRLRLLLGHMDRAMDSSLVCSRCANPITRREDICSVPGAEGVVGAYVNPHGVVHQTITTRRLLRSSYFLDPRPPTTKDTWFPGYGWVIACCSGCFGHIGWLFVRTHALAGNPQALSEFWGLSRAALVLQKSV